MLYKRIRTQFRDAVKLRKHGDENVASRSSVCFSVVVVAARKGRIPYLIVK